MILLIHKNEVVTRVVDLDSNQPINNTIKKPIDALFHLAHTHKERILVWCHELQYENLNIAGIKTAFSLKNMMLSYGKNQYFLEQIGYVEDSPFLKVNKRVKYPTWLMSSQVGAIHTSQLIKFKNIVNINNSFDFVLNSIAKTGMPNGLFCYSEPKLLNDSNLEVSSNKASITELFKFIKAHYKSRWCLLILVNYIVYERKFPFLAFVQTIFVKKVHSALNFDFQPIEEKKSKTGLSIDIIIPTIGRKKYLKDVLVDISKQTLLPKKVIIVEQNNDKSSKTELDYITNTSWPFQIIHKFIHQTGACNARNLALEEVTAEYVYLADDDNSFGPDLLNDILTSMDYYDLNVITMCYLQANEVEVKNRPLQWSAFGAGSSVIASKLLKNVAFNTAYEFGYAEDSDFGMQLRNVGEDVIYFPEIKILHLKAPIGGFRTPFPHPWLGCEIQPKPSPTVMLYRLLHTTNHQLLGYKTVLFLKFFKAQKNKNPFTYFVNFNKQWNESKIWANRLNRKF